MITHRAGGARHHKKRRKYETWRTFGGLAESTDAGFGALRSLDEVRLNPGASLPRHAARGGEVITYVSDGNLGFQDNLGRAGVVAVGEFQVLTAGSVTRFDGTNISRTQTARVFQLWLDAPSVAFEPSLEQHRFSAAERRGVLSPVASPDARGQSVRLQTDSVLYSGLLESGQHVVHELQQGRRAWLHVVLGALTLADRVLEAGDGVGVEAVPAVSFTARSPSEVLLLDVSLPPAPPVAQGPGEPESLALLDGGAQAYPRMLLAIDGARRTVCLEVYAFALSGVGEQFVAALSRAAERGVAVHVVLDGWGSARDGRTIAAMLRGAGCPVRIHNPLLALFLGRFGRNHRKVLLVDDSIGFIGGINIGDENLDDDRRLGWADLALEIHGEQCARLSQTFRDLPERSIQSALRIYLSGLGAGWRLRRRYLRAFNQAHERIHVAHGYFLPDAAVVRAIVAAARRGVVVRLLLAGRSDVPFARVVTRSLYGRLLAAGVQIHEWTDSVLHAKVATVDGNLLLVGSFNLDPFSLVNLESLVEVDDQTIVSQGEAWIQDHLARSPVVTAESAGSRWQIWLLGPVGRIVARAADALARLIAIRRLPTSKRRKSGARDGD